MLMIRLELPVTFFPLISHIIKSRPQCVTVSSINNGHKYRKDIHVPVYLSNSSRKDIYVPD